MIFLKFGKEEHLNQLKDGIVHFRPLASFVEDSTHFRGDRLETFLLGDPSYPLIINGTDFSPYIKEIKHTYDGFSDILSFSVAKLDHNNCHLSQDGIYAVNDDFINEMKQFGSHVLIFRAEDFITAMRKALKPYNCNVAYRSIYYCDKTNYAAISKHFTDLGDSEDPYEYCFIKDYTPYAKQNEWRIFIHDVKNEFPIEDTGGVNIKTEFRTKIPLFETNALTSLFLSEEWL